MRIMALGDRDPAHLTHREIDATLGLLAGEGDCGGSPPTAHRPGSTVDAVWLLPGTPYRDDDAARAAIHHCLDTGTRFLGTCGGFQYACVELARARAGVSGPTSAELDPDGEALVVAPLACTLYGERRTVTPVSGTRLAAICGTEPFAGHHQCGYGLADAYEPILAGAGVVISALLDAAVARLQLQGVASGRAPPRAPPVRGKGLSHLEMDGSISRADDLRAAR